MRGGQKEGGTQFASVLFASAFVNHIHHSKGDASFFPLYENAKLGSAHCKKFSPGDIIFNSYTQKKAKKTHIYLTAFTQELYNKHKNPQIFHKQNLIFQHQQSAHKASCH